jgi:hypothetical protein
MQQEDFLHHRPVQWLQSLAVVAITVAVVDNNPRRKGNNCRCHSIRYWQEVQVFPLESPAWLVLLLAQGMLKTLF